MSQMNASYKMPAPMGQSQRGSFVFGYVSQTDKMQFFNREIKQYEAEGKIPKLDTEAEYTIYRWKSRFLSHESIVVGFHDTFFTIEIRVMDNILTLYTTAVDINVHKLKYCAKKLATGYTLISKAVNVFQSMNPYHFACNNCQDFLNLFLEAIDLAEQVKETDMDWLAKMGILTAGVGGAALLLYSVMKPPTKNKK